MKIRFILLFTILIFSLAVQSQDSAAYHSQRADSAGIHKGRLIGVLSAQGTLYFGSLNGLYYAWYKGYPQSSFHLFNDNGEWLQMDKCGHATSAYYESMIFYYSYRWAGLGNTASALYGGLLAMAYQLNIEILDGFSSSWGFSIGDFTANTLGAALFVSQQLIWKEQRLKLKYSFHQTSYPVYRPDLLGTNLAYQILKDYNGMSFWLSGNISSFLPKGKRFPRWLNIAFGYGAGGMTGANVNDNNPSTPYQARYRRFMLSVDVDLTRIPTQSKVLKVVFTVLSIIKIPAPAIEYNSLGNFRFYPLYY